MIIEGVLIGVGAVHLGVSAIESRNERYSFKDEFFNFDNFLKSIVLGAYLGGLVGYITEKLCAWFK